VAEAEQAGITLDQVVARKGLLAPDEMDSLVAQELGVPYIDLSNYVFEADVVHLISDKTARRLRAIPLFRIGDSLTVAMARPDDIEALDELKRETGRTIQPALASEAQLDRALQDHYEALAADSEVTETAQHFAAEPTAIDVPLDLKGTRGELLIEEAPIARYVSQLVSQAIADRASDIHIEPDNDRLRVRERVDGVLRTVSNVPVNVAQAVSSRVKVLAKMNIAERRRPQDGQFQVQSAGGVIDVRVSSFPTVSGENLVLRLLDKSSILIGLDDLGFSPANLKELRVLLSQPNGILLVTGPTGSGKTTTLYAALQSLNSEERNIITIEDPVEYRLPLVRQCQVNVKAGITFASGLRSVLRQDPDIIMVGEVRDPETAEVAIQAALTGHLVLSTLHTNDAASALTRLLEMNVEPFLVASCVVGIVAQRLVRRVCDHCRVRYRPDPALLKALSLAETTTLVHGQGCLHCRGTGFRGRTTIAELLVLSEDIRRLVADRVPSPQIAAAAVSHGMKTLRDDGLGKVVQGITAPEELLKATRTR
jgi:type IV pilus assembly protein PilB